jgi:Flp pilus assembly protein TadG
MFKSPQRSRLQRMVKRFRRAEAGNVAIMFSLCVVPLLFAAGTAVDYMRASAARSSMEQALDAAALAVGNNPNLSNDEMKALAQKYFKENYSSATEEAVASIRVAVNNDRIALTVNGKVPTTLMGMFGYREIPVSIRNEVARGGSNIEVAVALDTTGSMSGQKITDLKAAAKELVDIIIQDDQSPYYSKVALAPYANAVNVGATLAPQLRGATTSGTCTTPTCASYRFTNANGGSTTFAITSCVTERTGAEAYTEVRPDPAVPSTWLGKLYTNSSAPCPTAQIMPLSTDRTALKNRIDSFVASGTTAGQIGIAWARYLLSPSFASFWPADSRPADYSSFRLIKAAVIMTDGEFNTMYFNGVVSRNSTATGNNNNKHTSNAANGFAFAQARQHCDAMKANGIKVYTVGFQLDEQSAIDFMAECATDANHAYNADTGLELRAAFRDIANDIAKLRLTH